MAQPRANARRQAGLLLQLEVAVACARNFARWLPQGPRTARPQKARNQAAARLGAVRASIPRAERIDRKPSASGARRTASTRIERDRRARTWLRRPRTVVQWPRALRSVWSSGAGSADRLRALLAPGPRRKACRRLRPDARRLLRLGRPPVPRRSMSARSRSRRCRRRSVLRLESAP